MRHNMTFLNRVVRALVAAVRDIHIGQQVLWDSYHRFDDYLQPSDPRYLHWEPSDQGWILRGKFLPREECRK